MIIEANRSSLLSACQLASQALPTRTPNPIYMNFKVTAKDGMITIQATDLEIEVSYYVDGVVIDEEGVAIWPAAKMVAILRESDDEIVKIDADGRRVLLITSASEYEMPGYGVDSFVDFKAVDGDFTSIESNSLSSAISRVSYAAAKDEGKYATRGILLELGAGELVGTDGKRMAMAKLLIQGEAPKASGVIPVKTMKMVSGIIDGDTTQVNLGVNTVTFKSGKALIHSRLVEGHFPPYKSVLPKKHEATVELECSALFHAVRQASVMVDDESKRVMFSFDRDKLTLEAQGASVGKSKVSMPLVGYKGLEITISFDPVYLTDYLRGCADGEKVKVELIDGKKPAVFKGEDYLYLVVPLV